MFQLVSEKAEEPEIKLPTSAGTSKKQESSRKTSISAYAKAFDCVDHNKLWKILKEMGIPDHLTCLLRNLYVGREATVRTGHGTTDWFPIGKAEFQGCILSPCLFNLYAEYLMQKARLEEAQAGIKIAGRNINNFSYADDTTLMAEREGTLKSLLQHNGSKASILRCSAFFIVQLSHPYMTTGKTIALTRWTIDSKVMSLLFNMLSRLVIAFLPKSKCLNFMAIGTICSGFGAQKCLSLFPLFPKLFAMK